MKRIAASALLLLGLIYACWGQTLTVQPYAPELFPDSLSSGVCGFSPDGKIIYFVQEHKDSQKLFLYEATKKGKRWVNAQLLPFSGQYNDYGGRLNNDGTILYFTSDRPGGSTRTDDAWNIWQVKLHAGKWGEAEPFTAINNLGNECCPVPLQHALLFSSERGKEVQWQIFEWMENQESKVATLSLPSAWQWPSYLDNRTGLLLLNSMKRADSKGMDDIYFAYYKNGAWTSPINLGEPVNTTVYEDGAILTPDKKWLLFCRHDTHETPSKVLVVNWKKLKNKLNLK